MRTYRLFPDDKQQRAIDIVQDFLPDDAHLALLSYTGGRAFGWGNEHHDIDLHGFFVAERWFNKCHAAEEAFDITITNIESFDNPDFYRSRFKNYYDKSNPIFIHDDYDFEEFMDNLDPATVQNVFPYDVRMQVSRLQNQFIDRAALHTYKEILIPLYYLEEGVIETNVVDVQNRKYQLEGLAQAAKSYKADNPRKHGTGTADGLDQDLILEEVEVMFNKLGRELAAQTDYEHDHTRFR